MNTEKAGIVDIKKKPILQVIFDMLEVAGKAKSYPPDCPHEIINEDNKRKRQQVVLLLNVLKRTLITRRQRKSIIKRLRALAKTCAFSGVGYSKLIRDLE